MTRFPIYGSAQPVDPIPNEPVQESAAKPPEASSAENAPANGSPALEPHDLEAALQLLVERAQYITGATGAALALAKAADNHSTQAKAGANEATEMVCRASAGSCAPPVGARLQVQSGLTGESVARKQLLRCDNAEIDPRVNRETCQQLGIASIVVLPLLSSKSEVRGLFELFSDHAYAFEERDLIALERMAELTRTALDLAEKSTIVIPAQPAPPKAAAAVASKPAVEPAPAVESSKQAAVPSVSAPETIPTSKASQAPSASSNTASTTTERKPLVENPFAKIGAPAVPTGPVATPASLLPPSMQRIQKCSSCGFPVSEGRTLCVDCEEKNRREPKAEEVMPAEFVPSFGVSGSEAPAEESWLANHVNLLAILVLILSIVVAVVVFR